MPPPKCAGRLHTTPDSCEPLARADSRLSHSARTTRGHLARGCPGSFLHRQQLAGPIVLTCLFFARMTKGAKTGLCWLLNLSATNRWCNCTQYPRSGREFHPFQLFCPLVQKWCILAHHALWWRMSGISSRGESVTSASLSLGGVPSQGNFLAVTIRRAFRAEESSWLAVLLAQTTGPTRLCFHQRTVGSFRAAC